jgi:hypothetical protein
MKYHGKMWSPASAVKIRELPAYGYRYHWHIDSFPTAIMADPTRRARALAILEQTGMLRSNYASPIFRLLWRLGLDVPPPDFVGFWPLAAGTTLWFGVAWGGFMWFVVWRQQHLAPYLALMGACCAGLMFGVAMAGYYAWGRKKYKLPRWETLGEG